MRSILTIVALILAVLLVVLAAAATRPPDIAEMLSGFAFGRPLPVVAMWLALAAAALAVLALWSNRPARRGIRVAALATSLLALVAFTASAWRYFAPASREGLRVAVAGAELEATRYEPRGRASSRPAVLILHGSGSLQRATYDFYARQFASRGFVVLNADKRGVGGSSGTYHGDDLANGVIELRTRDARIALDSLARLPGVDTARVGVVALSQGGWMVPLLLQPGSPARFGINLSGAAVSSYEENVWSKWAAEDGDHFGLRPPPEPFEVLDRKLATVKPDHFDPRPYLPTMVRPSLWLFGEWDASLPAAASMRVLDSVRSTGVNVTTRLFPGANHGLMVMRGPSGSRLANFAPGVWDSVFAWTDRNGITGR
jgi:dienelactone hydrolase